MHNRPRYLNEKIMRVVKPPKNTEFALIPKTYISAKYLDNASFRMLCYFYTYAEDAIITLDKVKTDLNWSRKDLDKCLETLIEYKFIISD